jgi:RNA polymerase sigma factor for flagellar operon FliA
MVEVSSVEVKNYWQNWNFNRDKEAGEALLRMHLPLVNYHVQRISVGLPRNINRDDLVSNGMAGLYDALEKFDSSRDLKFDTYASFRIRGAIIDGLRREDWLSRTLRDKVKKIEAAVEKLEQRLMRNVTPAEAAKEVGMTEKEVVTAMSESFFANVLSMDEENQDSEHSEKLGFSIEDKKTRTPEAELVSREINDDLSEFIQELSDKEQLVVSLFYFEELTLTEIGQVMSLSTSRISQIHSKALFKLRRVMKR